MSKYCIPVFITLLTICTSTKAQAQQKPSDRSLASELPLIKAKQAARARMLRQSSQATTTGTMVTTLAPANSAALPATAHQPAQGMPVIKASQKPMKIPARPITTATNL
jgi:hypothetical protein